MRSLSLPYIFLVKKTNTQQTRTCSELSIETLGKGVKYLQQSQQKRRENYVIYLVQYSIVVFE